MVGLNRNSAVEYGQFGIAINVIAQGGTLTAIVEESLKQWNPEQSERMFAEDNPMKRFGEPDGVAAAAAFLLSDDANFVNGAVLNIDGGISYKL